MDNTEKSQTGETENSMLEIIKPETVVNIKMSSGFYKKVQDLLGYMINNKTSEDLNNAHKQISEQNITEEWVAHYETMLILAKEFEERAREEGFISKITKEEAAELFKDELN